MNDDWMPCPLADFTSRETLNDPIAPFKNFTLEGCDL